MKNSKLLRRFFFGYFLMFSFFSYADFDFKAVAEKLEFGGDYYQISNKQRTNANILANIDFFFDLLKNNLSDEIGIKVEDLQKGYDFFLNKAKTIGLFDINAKGKSSVKVTDSLFRNREVYLLSEGGEKNLAWQMSGAKNYSFNKFDFFPANTLFGFAGDLKINLLLNFIEETITDWGNEEITAGWQNFLDIASESGLDLKAFVESFNGDVAFVLCADETGARIPLPIDGELVEIPMISFFLEISVENDFIYQAFLSRIEEQGLPLTKIQNAIFHGASLRIPLSQFEIILGQTKNSFFIGTSRETITNVFLVRNKRKEGFFQSENGKRMIAALQPPEEISGIWIVSPMLAELSQSILENIVTEDPEAEAGKFFFSHIIGSVFKERLGVNFSENNIRLTSEVTTTPFEDDKVISSIYTYLYGSGIMAAITAPKILSLSNEAGSAIAQAGVNEALSSLSLSYSKAYVLNRGQPSLKQVIETSGLTPGEPENFGNVQVVLKVINANQIEVTGYFKDSSASSIWTIPK